jgi:hypothetical protein
MPQPATLDSVLAELLKLKPGLAADFSGYVRRQWDRVRGLYKTDAGRKAMFQGNGTGWESKTYRFLAPFLNAGAHKRATERDGEPGLDEPRLARVAEEYAQGQIDGFMRKLRQKLAELDDVVIRGLDPGRFEFDILGSVDGHRVLIKQNRIINQSPLGTLYHQWPARIYVDGKFTPEATYKGLPAVAARARPSEVVPDAPRKSEIEAVVDRALRQIERNGDRRWVPNADDHAAHVASLDASIAWKAAAAKEYVAALQRAVAGALGVAIPGKPSKAATMRAISAAVVTGPASKADKARAAIAVDKAVRGVPVPA